MNKRIFNLLLGMLVILWIAISLILPPVLGLLSLFILGILVLVVLFLEVFNPLKKSKQIEDYSKVFEDPTFRDVSYELKEIFEREQGNLEEVEVGEEKKLIKKVSKVSPKYIGSKDNEKYHLKDCRFSKTINGKSRVEKTTRTHFVKNNYNACGVCKPDKN